MRKRRIFAGVIVVCLIALITMLLWPDRTKIIPPEVSLARIENAGVDDDEGKEMWWVTLSIRNPNNTSFVNEKLWAKYTLCVEDGVRPIEVNVSNSWVAIEGGLRCNMNPNDKHETAFAVPAGANSFRASLRYSNFELYSFRLARLARRLPRKLRSRLPNSFWQWSAPRYRLTSNWQDISVEVPLPPPVLPLPKFGE